MDLSLSLVILRPVQANSNRKRILPTAVEPVFITSFKDEAEEGMILFSFRSIASQNEMLLGCAALVLHCEPPEKYYRV